MKLINTLRAVLGPYRKRMEPSLIVLGAMKGGTSALYSMLAAHPTVLTPQRKELHFFNRDVEYAKGMDHYRAMFPLRPLRFKRFVTFEASPSYLPNPKVAARIAQELPNALLVALLRDPVERAYSAWNMYHFTSQRPGSTLLSDPRSFAQAVDEELAGEERPLQHSYLRMSDYAANLEPYMQRFPGRNLLLFGYPSFKRDPAAVVNSILARWELPPMDPALAVFASRANVQPYQDSLDPLLRQRLYTHFKPKVEELYELLGEDLGIIEESALSRR